MLDNQKTPSKSGKHPARRGLFMFFVIVAVAVVAGGTYWQYRHAEEIPASTSAEDTLVVKNREAGEAFLAKTAKEARSESPGWRIALQGAEVGQRVVAHRFEHGGGGLRRTADRRHGVRQQLSTR